MNKRINELNDAILLEINSCHNDYIIEVESTKNLSYNYLKKIKNKRVKFIIKSALSEEKYYNSDDDKYRQRTIFSLNQTKKLIKQFEKLDHYLNKDMSIFKKTLIIYKYLANRIKYEDKYCVNRKGKDKRRTLYSIVTKKAVCSGFALILFEALYRNNIENYYVHSRNHLFNVIKIKDKFYPVDITWESVLKKKNKDDLIHYFGNYPLFEKTHKLLDGEKVFIYSHIDSSVLYDRPIKLRTYKCNRNNKTFFYISELPIGKGLKFYAVYDPFFSIFNIVSSLEDFDRVFNGRDKTLIDCYKNSLLDGSRIKNKIENNQSYIGYGEIENNVFYKHSHCENIFVIKQDREKNLIKFKYLEDTYMIIFKNKKFNLMR